MSGFGSSPASSATLRRLRRGHRHGPLSLLGALAIGVALSACAGSTATPQVIYYTDAPGSATPAIVATATATPTTAPTPTPTLAPTPKPTPAPTPGPCNPSNLTLKIQATGGIYWQGGGGHQLATFALKNAGLACYIKAKGQALLLNGNDSILALGGAAGTSTTLLMGSGATLRTEVQTSNLCDAPAIVAPVRVAFMMPGGTGLIVATPLSASDMGGIPPCLGDPSVYSGSIEMQALAP